MCIAILKPKDKVLTKETLENCSVNNPDGCGFAYRNDEGKIIINKFMAFKDFWEAYNKVQENHTMLIHFRIATHGKVEIANCHPFKLNNHMALIHNGIISGYGSRTENLSDTRDFIDKVIGNISYKMWKNPSFIRLVGDAIGSSKFAILDNDENYYIVNEDKGTWDDGVWYSNTSYKTVKKVVSATKPSTTSTRKTVDNSWGYVMRCPSCGTEYTTQNWYENSCKHCHSELKTVGYIYNGEKRYYGNGGYYQSRKYNDDRYGEYDYSYGYGYDY